MLRADQIHTTEIDGVPTTWIDGSGPVTAILSFRVGQADEPLPASGLSHLVEHLALSPLGVQDYDHNGFVESRRTAFVIRGGPDDVTGFLGNLTRSLGDLPVDRLLTERTILRQEANERGAGLPQYLLWSRYGATGLGARYESEWGLGWLGPDPVRDWANRGFTRQNAVLVLKGPPPSGLRLDLADGVRWPTLAPPTAPGLRLPAHVPWDSAALAITLVIPRSPETNIAVNVLHRRLRTRLRYELGAVYDVALDIERLDGNSAHVMFATECDAGDVRRVVAVGLGVVDELAAAGPTEAEVASEVEALRRDLDDPEGNLPFLDDRAVLTLLGGVTRLPEEVFALRTSMTPEAVRAAFEAALGSMMIFGDSLNPQSERFTTVPMWSPTAVEGREIAPAGRHLPGRGPKQRLIEGRDGLTVRDSPTQQSTVRFNDVVVVAHATGLRLLVGRDGFRVRVAASDWKDGQAIIDRIDARVPPELIACDEHSPGALADPA